VGLPKKRADVILTGMAIYEAVLKELGFAEVMASTRGLRFAAAMQPIPPRPRQRVSA
jgi:exopolyphosphatase/pppGpp-phosphohydrolase